MTTRAEIINEARTYINKPFSFGGRGKSVDCIAIPLLMAKKFKVHGWERLWSDKECHAYPSIRPAKFLKSKLDQFVSEGILKRIDKENVQPGDMVLRFGGFNHDHHVSLMSYDGCIIEARNVPEAKFPMGRTVECTATIRDWLTIMCGYQFTDVT